MTDSTNPLAETYSSYNLKDELRRDDITITYNAVRQSDDEDVTLSVVAPQFMFDTAFIKRFREAAEYNIQLEHPNIIKMHEVRQKLDIVYVVREKIEGETLADYLKKHGSVPLPLAVMLIKQLASALDYAHASSVWHGDLSDTTIFIKDNHVCIADFGLTHAMSGTSLVKKGFFAGNSAYFSPERVNGKEPSRASDLYALGILTYQMLTGKQPFTGNLGAILYAQVNKDPEPLHQIKHDIPRLVSDAVLRVLSKEPQRRHPTGNDFVRDLQLATSASSMQQSASPAKPEPKPKSESDDIFTSPKINMPSLSTISLPSFLSNPLFLGIILAPIFVIILGLSLSQISEWLEGNSSISTTIVSTPVPHVKFVKSTMSPTYTSTPSQIDQLEQEKTVMPTATSMPEPIQLEIPTATPTSLIPTPPPPEIVTPTLVAVKSPTREVKSTFPIGGALVVNTPTISPNSPFTNLVFAKSVINDKPHNITDVFYPTQKPIYLFFDYDNIPSGIVWSQVWFWDDVVLIEHTNTWQYGNSGTAWVYHSATDGFQVGPYSVALKVNGEVVAVANFVVESN
ncbi:MAG: hypothetical protein B6242_16465 [Anaerolineaceae bacterium 4572_78]|nr:MAG: hypothetical protein B6242_16465 [Anaerolineaceae bacterium 4572_78]